MLTAAPIVRKPQEEIGAPGMTDYVRIYIASELNSREYRTTLRHEQAHVWAGHNRRRPKECNIKLWKIAAEMEIARVIYDHEDVENIQAPRSRLAGGYLSDTINGLPPELCLAEDIYEWLLSQPEEELPEVKCTCICCGGDAAIDNSDEIEVNVMDAAAIAREKLDAEEAVSKSQVAAHSAYKIARNRPPSLTDSIDAALRVRVERERSHRRPSRRTLDNVIMPGAISIPRPPLVEIFVDRSGSFSPDKTAHAELQLRKLLSRYAASIRADVWYFGNGHLVETDPGGGGDTPYHLISQHLSKSMPKLAIVITDDDSVGNDVKPIKGPMIICVPIGCTSTKLAIALGGKDVR